MNVIPAPREAKSSTGPMVLSEGVRIVLLPGNSPEDAFTAQLLRDGLGARLVRQDKADLAERGVIYLGVPAQSTELGRICAALGLSPDEQLGSEGYLLRVTPERAVIAANDSAGVFYGAQTLLQLVEDNRGERKILGVEVRDWPALRYRGIMDDISRGQVPTVDTLKRMIRTFARFKINFFSPYIEDMFVFDKHPNIGKGRGALTAAEWRDLCAYAARYHVIIVPQFEAFGHQDRLLSLPEYKGLAEKTGWSFAPANEGTYALLDELFGEMVRAFPGSELFGIGCDEVYDMGQGQSAKMLQELGPGGLFAYHIRRVNNLLTKRGRRPMMWGDLPLSYPEAANLLPKEVIILDWHYGNQESYPSIDFFRNAGFEVFTCPANSAWARIFPDYVNAFGNIEGFIGEGKQKGALGAMTCNWGDNGAENLIGTLWYGFLWAAECSWNAQPAVDRTAFDRAFARQMYGMRTGRITRAIKLLAETNRRPRDDSSWCFQTFHADPFAMSGNAINEQGARQLRRGAAEAIALLEEAAKEGGDNRDIPYLRFAARRLDYVGRKIIEVPQAAREYREALAAAGDPEAAAGHLREALSLLSGLRKELANLREEFARLWLAENREPGLAFNLNRYDAQRAAYDAKITALRDALRKLERAGELAPAEGLPAQAPVWGRAIIPQKGDVALPDARWDIGARRIGVRLEANGKDRTDLPVHLVLDFQALLANTGEFDPNSVRVILDGREIPSQFMPSNGTKAAGQLVWISPGTIAADAGRTFEIYFGTLEDGPAPPPGYPTDLVVTRADRGVWVENSKYRILLGEEGAHLFAWQVKALNGLDITQPGESDWHGFNDVTAARHVAFEIEPLGVGPVVASFRALEPWGAGQIVNFYAALPYVETFLNQGVQMYWNYDDVSVMAGDSATPGTARFSDGTEAAVPKSSELVHLTAGGDKRAVWSAKFRADGLTLGLITPDEPTLHMIGPGGSWGGIGIEKSNPCSHFVVFADVAPDTWQSVRRLADTLSLDPPVKAVIGDAEKPT